MVDDLYEGLKMTNIPNFSRRDFLAGTISFEPMRAQK